MRDGGRAHDCCREIQIERNYTCHALGSVRISAGRTVVLCTASVTETVPNWLSGMGHGWLTAEYAMLPSSTQHRKARDGRNGRTDGRSVEIQRLIGRSLRAALDLDKLPEVSIWIDCDVLSADGGTRTLAISGGYVALYDALKKLDDRGRLPRWPLKAELAATSVGIVDGKPLLDLDYSEDSRAELDMNVISSGEGEFAEIQMSAEGRNIRRDELDQLMDLATHGCAQIRKAQREALGL